MGYTTDFVGNLTIAPRLNEAEIDYLDAFRLSRRCLRIRRVLCAIELHGDAGICSEEIDLQRARSVERDRQWRVQCAATSGFGWRRHRESVGGRSLSIALPDRVRRNVSGQIRNRAGRSTVYPTAS